MQKHIFGVFAATAAAIFATAASAQQERMSPRPNYNLVQLTVKSAEVAPGEFKARTAAVRSCDQAVKLAEELGAQVTRNPYVRADQMPSQLNDILKDLPTGHATPVFSNDPGIMRVLVLCNRS